MTALDELDRAFGVRKQLQRALDARFGKSATIDFSVRLWPRRDAPTAAIVSAYQAVSARDWRPEPSRKAWFLIGRAAVEEMTSDKLFVRAVEYMSPVPHDKALAIVDVFEFCELGAVLRDSPSSLATDLAQVWHGPKIERDAVVFFCVKTSDGTARIHRITVDVVHARVDDAPL